MSDLFRRRLEPAVWLALAALCACSGGGASSPAMSRPPGNATPSATPTATSTAAAGPSPASSASNAGLAELTLLVPAPVESAAPTTGARAMTQSRGSHRDYISPSTRSLIITVDQVTNGGTPVLYSTTAYDLTGITTNPTTGITPDCTELTAAPTFKCQIYLNAPPTDSTQTDRFFIYEYNQPQGQDAEGGIGGPVPATYVPNGFLLAEDIGSNAGTGGDPVPSSANPGIALNANAQLTFNLYPVVEQPLFIVGGQSGTGLVLSAPGSGGGSNATNVSGFDETGNQIDKTLSGTGDNLFINQPTLSTSDATRFAPSVKSVGSVDQAVMIDYTPQTGDQPTSDTSTPLSGTASAQTVFQNGGFGGLIDYPIESTSIEVSPLFVYQSGLVYDPVNENETENVFALVHDLPTGVTSPGSYGLQYTTGSTCGDQMKPPFANPISYMGAGQYVQAEFQVIIDTAAPMTTPCQLYFSDGLVATPFTVPIAFTVSAATTRHPERSPKR